MKPKLTNNAPETRADKNFKLADHTPKIIVNPPEEKPTKTPPSVLPKAGGIAAKVVSMLMFAFLFLIMASHAVAQYGPGTLSLGSNSNNTNPPSIRTNADSGYVNFTNPPAGQTYAAVWTDTNGQVVWPANFKYGVTNFGILSANVCYLSQAFGSVTPVVGDPRFPFLTAQAAAKACPSNGLVYAADGVFSELVAVNTNQAWYVNDGVHIDGFFATNTTKFAVYGLGDIGLSLGTALIFSNYSSVYFECKNFHGYSQFFAVNTNLPLQPIVFKTRDYHDGSGVFLTDTNQQSVFISSDYITNLNACPSFSISSATGVCGSPNKTYKYAANRSIVFRNAPGSSLLVTNVGFYFQAPIIQFQSTIANRGPIALQGPSTYAVIVGADLGYTTNTTVSAIIKDNVTTNDLYLLRCRLNLGANPFIGATSVGQIQVHYIGCVNAVANTANSANVTNVVDNTVVDPAWTNAPAF